MGNIEIKADVNEAIEQLAQKLGLAADEILPLYTKQIMVDGIAWCTGGILLAILPWLLFLYNPSFPPDDGAEFLPGLWFILRACFCIGTTWGGGYVFFEYLENVFTPKALAMNRLVDQIF